MLQIGSLLCFYTSKLKLQKKEQYFCCLDDSDALQLRTADEREIFPKQFNSAIDFILYPCSFPFSGIIFSECGQILCICEWGYYEMRTY